MFCLPAGVVAIVMKRATKETERKKNETYTNKRRALSFLCIWSMFKSFAQCMRVFHYRVMHKEYVCANRKNGMKWRKDNKKKRKLKYTTQPRLQFNCMRCVLNWLFLLLLHLMRYTLRANFTVWCSRNTDSDYMAFCNCMSVHIFMPKMLSQTPIFTRILFFFHFWIWYRLQIGFFSVIFAHVFLVNVNLIK